MSSAFATRAPSSRTSPRESPHGHDTCQGASTCRSLTVDRIIIDAGGSKRMHRSGELHSVAFPGWGIPAEPHHPSASERSAPEACVQTRPTYALCERAESVLLPVKGETRQALGRKSFAARVRHSITCDTRIAEPHAHSELPRAGQTQRCIRG